MLEFLGSPLAQLVLSTAVLLAMTAVGVYVVRRFRGETEDAETATQLLTKFREMRYRGELSESEFRTIKAILSQRVQEELRQTGDSS